MQLLHWIFLLSLLSFTVSLQLQQATLWSARHRWNGEISSGLQFRVTPWCMKTYMRGTMRSPALRPLQAKANCAPAHASRTVIGFARIIDKLQSLLLNLSRGISQRLISLFSWPIRLLCILLPVMTVLTPLTVSASTGNKIVASKQVRERSKQKNNRASVAFEEALPTDRQLQQGQRGDALNKVGVVLVGGSIAYIAASGGHSTKNKFPKKKKRRSQKGASYGGEQLRESQEGDINDLEEELQRSRRQPSPRVQKQMKKIMLPSSADDLLAPEESIDDLFTDDGDDSDAVNSIGSEVKPVREDSLTTEDVVKVDDIITEPNALDSESRSDHISPILSQRGGRESAASYLTTRGTSPDTDFGDSSEPSLPPYAAIIPAPEDSKIGDARNTNRGKTAPSAVDKIKNTNEEAEVSTPPPPPPKKQGMFGRLFQKPGSGRPADLSKAMTGNADVNAEEQEIRSLIGSSLIAHVPTGIFPELEQGGEYASLDNQAFDKNEEIRINAIKETMDDMDISEQAVGEAFAEVASAMIVRLVDNAAHASDTNKASKEDVERSTAEALDVVSDFITGAGAIFGACTPRASINPIQYNGRTRKGKLESMFQGYLKSRGGDIASSLQGLLKGMGEEQETEEGTEKELSEEEMADRVGKIQFLFDIKANKREKIEQRIMREAVMNLGAGGKGSLEDMMSALTGGSNENMDAQMEDILKAAGVGDNGAIPDFGGAGMEGMPDMSNMSQEEVAAMTQEAMSSIKQSLAEGSITKEEIIEFEKMIGMDVNQLVKMVGANGMNSKRIAQQMGPEFADMIDVFKQLAKLKR